MRNSIHDKMNKVPKENLTVTPQVGEILLVDFTEETGRSRGYYGDYAGFDLFYGPDSRMFIPMGWFPGNLFARVTKNLEGLAKVAEATILEGTKKVEFRRR